MRKGSLIFIYQSLPYFAIFLQTIDSVLLCFPESYSIIHSEWALHNPVFGMECSSIRYNGSHAMWFSKNCSAEETVICARKIKSDILFRVPSLQISTTGTHYRFSTRSTLEYTSQTLVLNGGYYYL